MGILRSGLSETSKILGPTPKPIARTHNLYHYQILIKYRLEDELGPTPVSYTHLTNGEVHQNKSTSGCQSHKVLKFSWKFEDKMLYHRETVMLEYVKFIQYNFGILK